MSQHLDHMQSLARVLNQTYASRIYTQALETMKQRIHKVDETLSAKVIQDTLSHKGTWSFGSEMANQHAQSYEAHVLKPDTIEYFKGLAQSSLQKQQQLEQECTQSFDEYLTAFR